MFKNTGKENSQKNLSKHPHAFFLGNTALLENKSAWLKTPIDYTFALVPSGKTGKRAPETKKKNQILTE